MLNDALRSFVTTVSAAACLFLALPVSDARSQDAFLTTWYQKLETIDLKGLEELIAPGAIFTLEEFGSRQTREEFIDYMRQHGDALASVKIRYKVESQSATKTTVLVCYDFSEGDPVLNRETYTIENGRIHSAIQARIGDRCEDS